MAKRILVPLDGSTTTEAVLSLVGDMAYGANATVKLLHVARVPDNVYGADDRLVAYAEQAIARLEAQHLDYIATADADLGEVPVGLAVRARGPGHGIL